LAVVVGLGAGSGGASPLASPLSDDEASRVLAGACVGADTPGNCPANKAACETNCANKAAGTACAGSGYNRFNPTYRKTKDDDKGKKGSKSASLICGNLISCGPICVAAGAGTVCPTSTIADYQVENFPDPDSGDCAEEEARLDVRLGETSALFAVNGGLFNPFAPR
jgi:hypothetical protein